MSCLSSTRRAELQAQLTSELARLATLEAAYEQSLEGGVKSYRFDSGEGSQRTDRQSPKEISDLIDTTQARIDLLRRKLRGQGIVNINLRRNEGAFR